MSVITIKNTGQTLFCQEGDNLMKVLLRENIFINNPCNGKGTCGKCKVKIISNEKQEEISLSCMTEIKGDMTVELLQKDRKHKVLTKGYLPNFERDAFVSGYGIAMDIGTTTVITSLIDMKSGEELANSAMINAQKHFGLDVLTRITYQYENPETGIHELQKAIVDSINLMIDEVCAEAGIEASEIVEIDIAANCTMTHMLLGVDARPIGRSPYKPVFLEEQTLKAKDIGIQAGDDTILYCLPQVSGYIGADIVAGTYVCELEKEKGNVLFIDIGTNGEIVLASDEKLLCCSCAAGPALEGMNISSGMRAAEGAIEDVTVTPEGVQLAVIGDKAPEGICGSGILAVTKELLRNGIVRKTGAFIKKDKLPEDDYRQAMIQMDGSKRKFVLSDDPEIVVTQGDVRQVQLAKGAILSGFVALLNKAGITMDKLDKVMIAGQFGAHLPADSITGVGILPMELQDKLVYVGNASKTGAYMTLLSKKAKYDVEKLAKKMEYMELAESENYEKIFTTSMIFPEF